ncbi:MAG: FixH family protein [Anaerolineales bacterium]|nr:FixH family protein [Anaerolineales bacterium]MBP6211041.1 FixH family protein [Anaerolineales bacterium]
MKRTVAFIVVIVMAALIIFGVFAIRARRSQMMMGGGMGGMGGGYQLELMAVASDGKEIEPSSEVTSVTGDLQAGSAAQKSGDLIVAITLNPYPAKAGGPTEFDVTVTDLSGNPVDDAEISLDLTMPSMPMPPNKPGMEFVSDGKYHTSAPFTMRGWWRIEVIIKRGSVSQSVLFDLGL